MESIPLQPQPTIPITTTTTPNLGNDFEQTSPNVTSSLSIDNSKTESKSSSSCWNITYYRPYFNVNTKDVLERLICVWIPTRNWEITIKQNPDLYGPFWISTTLIFTIAVIANFIGFLVDQTYTDFTNVTVGATLIYGYVFAVPICLCLILWCIDTKISPTSLFCAYGYGLTPFIPAIILCLIPLEATRWLFICIATILSGYFIINFLNLSLSRQMPKTNNHTFRKTITLISCFLLHSGLALFLKFYFF
eukprot:c18016_g1_i1.p1 GENE.c18016_g1_i1~~c18016_g1_i1.p1  ORF type:complete len:249 (+),score=66.03 c18016_g1_i1:72-818(+)